LVKNEDSCRSLNAIHIFCNDQIKIAKALLYQVTSQYDDLMSDIDALYENDLYFMVNLETIFKKLKERNVDEAFYGNIPPTMDGREITYTLFDWVSIEDVHLMQKEGYGEMAALQKLSSYLKQKTYKLEKKI